ncbi:ase inhibitor propeptide protein [Rutstroemia sp. NJR-2017a BBW]|nr:ase inhibitor propeptide protein [Rutstroemia sp. NJR-2017a BBW]
MRFTLFSIFLLVAVALSAAVPRKAVIVSYPDDTPDSVIDKAMDAIRAAGGVITHEYKLIKGFAATAPVKVLETVQTWGNEYNAFIEDDQIVTAVGSQS